MDNVMAGLVPAIHVFLAAAKYVDARDKPAHESLLFRRRLAQTLHTQTALARDRHGQPHILMLAPAVARRLAGESGAAARAGGALRLFGERAQITRPQRSR
jgi:hypothetical protein